MKDRKKTIVIILIIILVIISILVLFLSLNQDDNNNLNNEKNETNDVFLEKVNNYEEFFAIQNTISDVGDLNVSYVVTEIYRKQKDNIKYYFINCSKLESDVGAETVEYQKNVFYLLIVDNNNFYELSKIEDSIDDLEVYAKSYNVKEKNVIGKNKLENGDTATEKILTIYLEYFKDMLYLDPEFAYNMLTDDIKNNYSNYNIFYEEIPNIYNKLTSRVFSYNTKKENDYRIYYIEDDNRNKIEIYEYGIMDFKISY